MSVEHQPRPSETHEHAQAELEALGRQRLEQLAATPEASQEHAEKRAQEARDIINQHETQPQEEAAPVPATRTTIAAHLDRALNYRHTLDSLQRRLSPASRTFSRVIHTPAIERTSEALEGTVMRPSVVTGALWCAAIVGIIFYGTARYYGYQLSGSEMLLSLCGGAVLGLIIEGLNRLLRHRRR